MEVTEATKSPFFIWTVLKQRLLTNVERRVRWHLAVYPSCPICGYGSKDILHTLKDCTAAKEVWQQVISISQFSNFFTNNLHE